MLMIFCYFTLNKLRIKLNKYFKFYRLLMLLSGSINLNPGPSQSLPDNDNKFEPFHKHSLHFLDVNINSLLSKTDEQRNIVDNTKSALLGITESKLDSSVSDQEVNLSGYSILRSDRNRYGRGGACSLGADLCFNRRNVF